MEQVLIAAQLCQILRDRQIDQMAVVSDGDWFTIPQPLLATLAHGVMAHLEVIANSLEDADATNH